MNVKDYIGKSSSYLIDLVEVGDYVNGQRVCEVNDDSMPSYMKEIYCDDSPDFGIWHESVKSVVTKERFKGV